MNNQTIRKFQNLSITASFHARKKFSLSNVFKHDVTQKSPAVIKVFGQTV